MARETEIPGNGGGSGGSGVSAGHGVFALTVVTGTHTISSGDAQFQRLVASGGGTHVVDLPLVDGESFRLTNASFDGTSLDVQIVGNTVGILNTDESAWFARTNGGVWAHLGIELVSKT